MDKLIIRGQKRLKGEVTVSGAKNAALGVLPAALLLSDVCTIENVPNILDITILKGIMETLGVRFENIDNNTLRIDTRNINSYVATTPDMNKLRGSYYLMGALLGRFKRALVTFPGGCNLGVRPIDQHIKGFEALGAKVEIQHGYIKLTANKLVGASIYLDVVSVGATINIMLAAVRAEGLTIIENAAKEPHIVDIANFLNAMGAVIKGAGTDVIRIEGVDSLSGTQHTIIPDRIEAGTFLWAAMACGGDIVVEDVIPKHVEAVLRKLEEAGAKLHVGGDSIHLSAKGRPRAIQVKTLPYPGFPTDLQPVLVAVMMKGEGTSIINERVFDNRFGHVDELKRFGGLIKSDGRTAVITGRPRLSAAPVTASDLRMGAALVVAALGAEGVTEIEGLQYIYRGYERFEQKLAALGAKARIVGIDAAV